MAAARRKGQRVWRDVSGIDLRSFPDFHILWTLCRVAGTLSRRGAVFDLDLQTRARHAPARRDRPMPLQAVTDDRRRLPVRSLRSRTQVATFARNGIDLGQRRIFRKEPAISAPAAS
jgi:hypothetical protein